MSSAGGLVIRASSSGVADFAGENLTPTQSYVGLSRSMFVVSTSPNSSGSYHDMQTIRQFEVVGLLIGGVLDNPSGAPRSRSPSSRTAAAVALSGLLSAESGPQVRLLRRLTALKYRPCAGVLPRGRPRQRNLEPAFAPRKRTLMHSRLFWLLFVAERARRANPREHHLRCGQRWDHHAPSGDRGWAETGSWQVGVGVAVAPSYFLTAQHLGGTAGQPFVLNGRTSAASFTDITGSDLRLVKITGTFPAYAPLYRGAAGSEAGQAISMIGFGRYAHGSALVTNGTQSGWNWGAAAGKNFAMNTAAGAVTVAGSQLIDYSFDPISGRSEGIYAAGDSGGGTFKVTRLTCLAGINFAVTNFYSQPLAPNPLQASIFNGSGLLREGPERELRCRDLAAVWVCDGDRRVHPRIDAVILPATWTTTAPSTFADLLTSSPNTTAAPAPIRRGTPTSTAR